MIHDIYWIALEIKSEKFTKHLFIDLKLEIINTDINNSNLMRLVLSSQIPWDLS